MDDVDKCVGVPCSPLTPSEDEHENILHKFSDDILLDICERLPLNDLCSVAEVCRKFKSIAINIVQRKYTHYDLQVMSELGVFPNQIMSDVLWQNIKRWFRIFGVYFVKIDLIHWNIKKYDYKFLQILARYCSGQTAAISELRLNFFTIKSNLIIKRLRPIFAKLKLLSLNFCTYRQNIRFLLNACVDINVLEISNLVNCYGLEQTMPKLKELSLGVQSSIIEQDIDRFLQMNSQLKKLKIVTTDLSSEIYCSIGNHLPELEELVFNWNLTTSGNVHENIRHMSKLKNLKSLQFVGSSFPVQILLQSLIDGEVPIEHLSLMFVNLNKDVADCISKFKNIKVLGIYGGTLDADLSKMIESMPDLNKFGMFWCGSLKLEEIKHIIKSAKKLEKFYLFDQIDINFKVYDFKEIIQSILDRSNGNILELKILGNNCKSLVPKEMYEKYVQYLNLKIDTENNQDVAVFRKNCLLHI